MTNGSPLDTESIKRWKDPGAPVRPKGKWQIWYRPMPGPGQNAVFIWSWGVTGSYQYPLCRCNVVNTVYPASLYLKFMLIVELCVGETKEKCTLNVIKYVLRQQYCIIKFIVYSALDQIYLLFFTVCPTIIQYKYCKKLQYTVAV